MQNRRASAPYRTSQSHGKEDEDQNSVILTSPSRENFEETRTHIVTDTKQMFGRRHRSEHELLGRTTL